MMNNVTQENLAQLEQIVKGCLDENNETREKATAAFGEAKKNVDLYFVASMRLVQASNDDGVRQFLLVMMRQSVKIESKMWASAIDPVKATVKDGLAKLLVGDCTPTIRRKVADAIGMLAAQIFSLETDEKLGKAVGRWPELLPMVINFGKSQDPVHREAVLKILGSVVAYSFDHMKKELPILKKLIQASLLDQSRHEVVKASLKLLEEILRELNQTPEVRKEFHDCIPQIFGVLAHHAKEKNDMEVRELLEGLMEIAEPMPTFFRPHLKAVVAACVAIANAKPALEPSTRRMALAFLLVMLSEGKGMVRKLPEFSRSVIPLAFKFMLDVEADDKTWSESPIADDFMGWEEFEIGLSAIDQFALYLGPKGFLPVGWPIIVSFLKSKDWLQRHAGMTALENIMNPLAKEFATRLKELHGMILPYATQDPNPRVRVAALNALSTCGTQFAAYPEEYHAEVLKCLVASLDVKLHHRIVWAAVLCLTEFIQQMEGDDVLQYIDGILGALAPLLGFYKNRIYIQESVVAGLSAVAHAAGGEFTKHYDKFIPGVMQILTSATHKDQRGLRSRAMEAVGTFAKAVGGEKFLPHAKPALEVMVAIYKAGLDSDDPLSSYLIQAISKICQAIGGKEFSPYAEHIIPHLLKIAEEKEGAYIVDSDHEYAKNPDLLGDGFQAQPMPIRGIEDKSLVMNTAILDEKAEIMDVLFHLCTELQQYYAPYVNTTFKLVLKMVTYRFQENVRVAAVNICPSLMTAVAMICDEKKQPRDDVGKMWDQMVQPILDSIKRENTLDNCCGAVRCLQECIEVFQKGPADYPRPKQMLDIAKVIKQLMDESDMRRQEREERRQSDDFDEEEETVIEEENASEDEFLGFAHGVISALCKVAGDAFLPAFKTVFPSFEEYIKPKKSAGQRTAAICVFCDVMDRCPKAVGLAEKVFPYCTQYLKDPSVDVRQSVAYALGACARVGGKAFIPAVQPALKALHQLITGKDAKEGENCLVHDNAISSVAKICIAFPDHCQPAQTLPMWLSWLPIKGEDCDAQEAPHVHAMLCDFIEKKNPYILGQNNSNLPQIIKIFAELLGEDNQDICPEPTQQRIINIWRGIQKLLPAPAMATIWKDLSQEQQAALKPYVQA